MHARTHARTHTTTHAYTQTCAHAHSGTPPPPPPTHTPHTCIHTVLGLTQMCSPQILHNSSLFFPHQGSTDFKFQSNQYLETSFGFLLCPVFPWGWQFGCAAIYCKSVLTAVPSFFMSYDDFFFVLYCLGAGCLAVLRFVLTAVSSFISYDDFLFVLYFLGAGCFTVLRYIVSLCQQPLHVLMV